MLLHMEEVAVVVRVLLGEQEHRLLVDQVEMDCQQILLV
jgi:hypothetical protein